MKVFIIRHEKRDITNPSFETELTEEGKENSRKLALFATENMEKFTHIYTSPFIRCIQTIEPLLLATTPRPKLYCDYALHEYIHEENKEFFKEVKQINDAKNYLCTDYKPVINTDKIKLLENPSDISFRVELFKRKLLSDHSQTNDNILIVTHMSVVNEFLKNDLHKLYPMGEITQLELKLTI